MDRKELCSRAFQRLSAEEHLCERSRKVPYACSLSALAGLWAETAGRQGWEKKEGPVVLAVSGGSDSMALMWLFRVFYGGPVVAAHLEHGIRGEASEEDALFVGDSARRWGMGFEMKRLDVPALTAKGESLEAAARRLRYAFLEEVAAKHSAWGVALGHNREDVAETVLFNLLRGTGVRGAVGMPESRGIFFRPLLSLSKDFLRDILRCRGLAWREDCTNADARHTRNFIRNELLPLVSEKINARAVEHLVAFAQEMRYYRSDEESRGAALLKASGYRDYEGGGWADRQKLRALSGDEVALLLRAVARRLGWGALSRERAGQLALLISGTGGFEFQWGGGASVFGERERVLWMSQKSGG